MTARKRPGVIVDIGRWTAEVCGPVRFTVPAVRQACGHHWTMTYDNRARSLRVPLGTVADVIAALEAAKVRVNIKGTVPEQGLW